MQCSYTRVSNCLPRAVEFTCRLDSDRCGGTIGIYFPVKTCSLLYLYDNKGTFESSPYLDDHGEVDMSMRYESKSLSMS